MPEPDHATAVSIDKAVTLEIRVRSENLPSGVVHDLHEAALDVEGEPLCLAAGRALSEAVEEGDTVLVATGAGKAPWLPVGETDGPPGAVGLARGLALGLGARPVLVSEERKVPSLEAAAHACGLNNVPYDQLLERTSAVSIVPFPEEVSEAESAADRFMDRYDPAAVIAVEKLGPNREGVIHSITGQERAEGYARIETLFDRANDAGVLTVGVGDGGNEIGFGTIEDAVREIQPYGDRCVCPCEDGVATRVPADHVVVGGTSNWGAYGVQAVLALTSDTPAAMHTPDDESRMLEHLVSHGVGDGVYGRPVMGVDGTTEATNRGVVAILENVVENSLTEIDRPF